MPTRQMQLGQVPIPPHRKDTDETEEVWKYVIEECMPPIRLVTWKDIKPLMDSKEIMSWGGLDHNAYQYIKFLHEEFKFGRYLLICENRACTNLH